MLIGGLQKLTLLDFPERVACTVFTYGCNLRCPYCHNASLVVDKPNFIKEDEFFSFLNKRVGILDGVCVSGGEPLLNKDIGTFLKKIKDLGYKVKLDTNGTNPKLLEELINEGLVDYVAMDVKNSLSKYVETVGTSVDVDEIAKSIKLLLSDKVDYEFRTTVVKNLHNEESIKELALMIKGAKRYFLQNFVDSGNLVGYAEGLSEEEMRTLLNLAKEYVPNTALRGI